MQSVFKKFTDAETWSKIVDYESVSQMWQNCVENYAEKQAIIDGESFTFAQIDARVRSVRAYLKKQGVERGDKVGIFMPNSVHFAIYFLAVTTMGAVAVLLPPHLDKMAVFGCSLKFQLKALAYFSAFEERLEIIKLKNGALALMNESVREDDEAPCCNVGANEPCTVIFTGGTTGKSKGALLSNGAVMRGVKNGCFGTKEVFGLRYMLVLPLTHVFGLIRNLLTSLYTGSTLFICKNNKDMFRDIAVFKPTIIVLVPAVAEMALNLSKQFGRNMLGDDMKVIICGAAAVSPYLIKEYEKLGIAMLAGYGLTESANLVSGNPKSLEKPESVGYVYDDILCKVVNGELWLKGPNMMEGYFGEPEENQNAYEDGWFKTGDLVRFDEEGMLYITGRVKEVIVLPSGENISPQEVEIRFNELEIVQDSLVYLDQGRLALEVYPRYVTLNKVDVEDKIEYLKQEINKINAKLPSFMQINKIVVRDSDFERSPSMKILRKTNEA